MADKSVRVEVRGLRELDQAFRSMEGRMDGALKAEFLGLATRVADTARGKVAADVGAGKAAASIKPKASARGASIAFGGTAAPYYPWLDFGGSVGRGHKPGVAWSGAITRDWRGKPSGEGRYVYPAIREHRADIAAGVDDVVTRLAQRAGFETREGL